MRQQFGAGVKIHEIITNGGQTPNIIPSYASMWIFARAVDKELLEKVAGRIINIGKGASLMTGAEFKYKRAENTFYDLKRDEMLKPCEPATSTKPCSCSPASDKCAVLNIV